jgi:hypothetical protein
LLLALLGLGLLSGRLRWPPLRQDTAVHIGLWGLTVASLLSTTGVVPIYTSLRFLTITLFLLSLFSFVRMYAISEHAVRIVLVGYSVSAVLNALVVIVSFLGISLPFSSLAWSVRGVGFFKDSNVYGPFVVVAVLWVADRVVQRSFSLIRTGPLLFLVGLLSAGAVVSMSRGAWINLFFGGGIYFLFLLRGAPRSHIVRFLALALMGVLVVVFVLQLFGLGEVIARRSQLQDYDALRFDTQRRGILAGLAYPLGVGSGGWPNTHSLYVRTLAEHGVLGLTSLGLLVGGLVIPLARRAWRNSAKNPVLPDRVLLAWIGGQLINSLVIDSIHWRHLWVVLGLAWASLRMQEREIGCSADSFRLG